MIAQRVFIIIRHDLCAAYLDEWQIRLKRFAKVMYCIAQDVSKRPPQNPEDKVLFMAGYVCNHFQIKTPTHRHRTRQLSLSGKLQPLRTRTAGS